MGGTRDVAIGHPANGVPLCGDGVRGCHGWAEKNREDARLLGWLLEPGQTAVGAPFWSRIWGWRAWHVDEDFFPSMVYVDEELDLDEQDARQGALARFRAARPEPAPVLKSQR